MDNNIGLLPTVQVFFLKPANKKKRRKTLCLYNFNFQLSIFTSSRACT